MNLLEAVSLPDVDIRNTTFVEVDLDAVRSNITTLAASTGCAQLVVVKANAYGHGAVQVSRTAVDAGARMLGVATIGEAVELRRGGIQADLLILGPVTPHTERFYDRDISQVIWTKEHVAFCERMAQLQGIRPKVHVEVDVGMGRFGIKARDAVEFVDFVSRRSALDLEGTCTHLSSSDVDDPEITLSHIETFADIVNELDRRGLRPNIVHCGNSAAAMRFPAGFFDMLRLGIATYGISPVSFDIPSVKLRPALSWKSVVLNLQRHAPGDRIGYGGEYVCPSEETIAVIGVGYADGFRRTPKNVNDVLLAGYRTSVVGRLCMQHCMLRLDDQTQRDVRVGDEVVMLGEQAGLRIDTVELARKWNTNDWDVVCGINPLIRREYKPGL
jgi:alanine racemase